MMKVGIVLVAVDQSFVRMSVRMRFCYILPRCMCVLMVLVVHV